MKMSNAKRKPVLQLISLMLGLRRSRSPLMHADGPLNLPKERKRIGYRLHLLMSLLSKKLVLDCKYIYSRLKNLHYPAAPCAGKKDCVSFIQLGCFQDTILELKA